MSRKREPFWRKREIQLKAEGSQSEAVLSALAAFLTSSLTVIPFRAFALSRFRAKRVYWNHFGAGEAQGSWPDFGGRPWTNQGFGLPVEIVFRA